ncbi:MAG: hypothetical protein ACT4PT_13375 [Methanobacteriota archaeon]
MEHIQVKTPEDNGCIESFFARLDRDCLNLALLDDDNKNKPKKRLGWLTPPEYYTTKNLMTGAH